MDNYVLEMRNITKRFPNIVANDDITIQLKRQEIMALIGENGAGKSTLMSILFGMYQPDEGQIFINGEPVTISDPNEANRYKIGMVHQHFKLVSTFTALENIVLGVESSKMGFLKMKEAREKVKELTDHYKLMVDPDMLVADMTVGMQQRVEILKMLYRENDILIFDEPTAVLTPQEIDELMDIMKNLVKEGKSIIFITHKLAETMKVADRCTVLRRGKNIGTVEKSKTTREELSEMMVGRKVNLIPDKENIRLGDVMLKVENLCVYDERTRKNVVNNVSFEVREGEVVCIAGIDGNGQTELVHALTGLRPISSGKMFIKNEDMSKATVRMLSRAGEAHIPEDRHKHGMVLDYNLEDNLILQNYYKPEISRHGVINAEKESAFANELIEKYDIRSGSGAKTKARSMSGGNQQKAVVAREIARDPNILIAVQPTRGLDVGAIEYIHNQIVAQRNKGKAVLLVSLELEEVLNVSDRILVIFEGEIIGELDPKKTTFQEIGLYMSGAKRC